jgi:2,4-dienoyl-CoA reductase-like NADH-dependent reductase (Old Yellow Enzyme family)
MTVEDIKTTVRFSNAAVNSVKAGFDGVIHSSNGYLFQQLVERR